VSLHSVIAQCHCTVSLHSVIARCHCTVSLHSVIAQCHCTVSLHSPDIYGPGQPYLYNPTYHTWFWPTLPKQPYLSYMVLANPTYTTLPKPAPVYTFSASVVRLWLDSWFQQHVLDETATPVHARIVELWLDSWFQQHLLDEQNCS